ncbi:hypothetical protein Tco_1410842 [Tanacetum coccineum]
MAKVSEMAQQLAHTQLGIVACHWRSQLVPSIHATLEWHMNAPKRQPIPSFGTRHAKGVSKQPTVWFLPEDRLREICDKHYNQLLPMIAEKVHPKKLQEKKGPEKGGSQVQAPCPKALTTPNARASSPDSGMTDQDPLAKEALLAPRCSPD